METGYIEIGTKSYCIREGLTYTETFSYSIWTVPDRQKIGRSGLQTTAKETIRVDSDGSRTITAGHADQIHKPQNVTYLDG